MGAFSRLRAAGAALAVAALTSGPPASAQVGPRTVSVYPVAAAKGANADAADVQSLLDAALHRLAQRNPDVLVGVPLVTRLACGIASAALPSCLAGLAAGGIVLRVTVHRSQNTIVALMEAVDARARLVGPVTVSIDAFAQSAEPLVQGVNILFEMAQSAARPRPDLRAAVPLPPPPVLGKPPAAAKPVAVAEAGPARRPRSWMRTAGPWITGTGAALLAGGLAVSFMSRTATDELDRKFQAGTLTASDRASYDRIEQYDSLTRALLASGAALTLSGVAIWTAAPARGGTVAGGVAGRF